jgi:hypothetical protein
MNNNLKMLLDALVESMKKTNSEAGVARLTLEDGTECALILSVNTDATELLTAALQVVASGVPVTGAKVTTELVN